VPKRFASERKDTVSKIKKIDGVDMLTTSKNCSDSLLNIPNVFGFNLSRGKNNFSETAFTHKANRVLEVREGRHAVLNLHSQNNGTLLVHAF
jgi:hypothetical protein